jgi:LuxR family maltose regulon positive regulatory protein
VNSKYSADPQLQFTTVATKLRPPRQLRQLLSRARLLEEIEHGLAGRLVILSAPAGYGKTSLLGQAFGMLQRAKSRACWLSIDEHDNDVVRFVAHLAATARQVGVILSPPTRMLLESNGNQGQGPSANALLTGLLNEFAALDDDLFVFLDDFHLIREAQVVTLVSELLLAPLERVHILVSARQQPTLPLARLRARGELSEIDAGMLAFSAGEATQFLETTLGRKLSETQAAQLHDKTEGWIASLQMAAIAMQGAADPDAFLHEFSGADRSVADFLMEEVLQRQPHEIQEFLLATSLLDKFNAPLCNAVLGRDDAADLIKQAEQLNLFLFSLDRERGWYRYHRLFAELLRQHLVERHSDLIPRYHERACAWLAQHGHVEDAIEHACAGGDLSHAATLIDAISPALFANGQTAMLRSYAQRLPAEMLKGLPRLQLELAWENLIRWRFDEAREARRMAAQAAAANPESTGPHSELVDAKLAHRDFMLAVFTDDFARALPAADAWLLNYGSLDQFMRSSVHVAMLMCQRDIFQCELPQPRCATLRSQLLEAHAVFGTIFLDTVAGSVHYERGELQLAEHAYVQARMGAIRIQGEHSVLSAMPSAQLACLHYERNNLVEARELIFSTEDVTPEFGLVDSVIARYVTAARLERAAGFDAAAHRWLDQATHLADRWHLPRLHAHVLGERIPLLLSEGLVRDAQRLLLDARYADVLDAGRLAGHADGRGACLALAAARVALEEGETHQTAKALRRWINWTRERACLRTAIPFALLLAKLNQRNGDALAARRALLDALGWGVSGGFMRSFLDEGPAIGELLRQLAEEAGGADAYSGVYVQRMLAAFGYQQPDTEAPADMVVADDPRGLGKRELDILRLSARNLDTREIAAALGLADTTVKWYWKRIFEKLGVRRRALAVAAARQRGLIA